MGEVTLYECDVTGERFGAKNDVVTIAVKRRSPNDPFRVNEYDVHICDSAIEDRDLRLGQLQNLDYVALDGREIVGAGLRNSDGRPRYHDRSTSVVIHSYESAFEFLEEEVIV